MTGSLVNADAECAHWLQVALSASEEHGMVSAVQYAVRMTYEGAEVSPAVACMAAAILAVGRSDYDAVARGLRAALACDVLGVVL